MTNTIEGTRASVLLIDDEQYPLNLYIRALERDGFMVDHRVTVEDALKTPDTDSNIAAIVLDIMMSPGKFYQYEDHHEGIKTGIFLYRDLCRLYPGVPIIVATNVTDEEILDELLSQSPKPVVVSKVNYPPIELSCLVKNTVKNSHDRARGR